MQHTKFQIDLLNSQTTFRQGKKEKQILLCTEQKKTHANFNGKSNNCENCPKKLFGMG